MTGPRANVSDELVAGLVALGLLEDAQSANISVLNGGVSAEIVRVECAEQTFCAKRALAQLKTAAEWHAPLTRSQAETSWLRLVESLAPGAVPHVLAEDRGRHMLVMEYLPADRFGVWKQDLLAGRVVPGVAGEVGDLLGRIHAATARREDIAVTFDHAEAFEALRLDPYFRFAAKRHVDLASALDAIARRTAGTRLVLIHGDVSPKNILVGEGRVVFLDAECATCGDPAFDVAFCLSHLVLKATHAPARHGELAAEATELWDRYCGHVTWERRDDLQARTCELLAAFLLARIDGKSPVEYLAEASRQAIRDLARNALVDVPTEPAAFFHRLTTSHPS